MNGRTGKGIGSCAKTLEKVPRSSSGTSGTRVCRPFAGRLFICPVSRGRVQPCSPTVHSDGFPGSERELTHRCRTAVGQVVRPTFTSAKSRWPDVVIARAQRSWLRRPGRGPFCFWNRLTGSSRPVRTRTGAPSQHLWRGSVREEGLGPLRN